MIPVPLIDLKFLDELAAIAAALALLAGFRFAQQISAVQRGVIIG
jgi:hypothetical protein